MKLKIACCKWITSEKPNFFEGLKLLQLLKYNNHLLLNINRVGESQSTLSQIKAYLSDRILADNIPDEYIVEDEKVIQTIKAADIPVVSKPKFHPNEEYDSKDLYSEDIEVLEGIEFKLRKKRGQLANQFKTLQTNTERADNFAACKKVQADYFSIVERIIQIKTGLKPKPQVVKEVKENGQVIKEKPIPWHDSILLSKHLQGVRSKISKLKNRQKDLNMGSDKWLDINEQILDQAKNKIKIEKALNIKSRKKYGSAKN